MTMTDNDGLSEEEIQLFRSRMQGVTPLAAPVAGQHSRARTPASRKAAERHRGAPRGNSLHNQQVSDETPLCHQHSHAVEVGVDEETGVSGETPLCYRRPEVRRKRFVSLRRGKLFRQDCQQDRLDLHGQNECEAQRCLRDFLADRQERGARCVLLVHGKGRGSQQSLPVLKNSVNTLLREHPGVLAFCSAQQEHGGTGALYILLRPPAGR